MDYVIYSTDYDHRNEAFGLCADSVLDTKWATNVCFILSYESYLFTLLQALKRTVPTQYHATTKNILTGEILFLWIATLRKDYEVRVEAWHNVAFEVCTYDTRVDHARITGQVSFRNPYGYIPAELYGIRPFEVCVSFSVYGTGRWGGVGRDVYYAVYGVRGGGRVELML